MCARSGRGTRSTRPGLSSRCARCTPSAGRRLRPRQSRALLPQEERGLPFQAEREKKKRRESEAMTTEVAQIVLAAITTVAAVVWLAGLQYLLTSARQGAKSEDREGADAEMVEDPLTRCLSGSAEVEGQAGALASKAA